MALLTAPFLTNLSSPSDETVRSSSDQSCILAHNITGKEIFASSIESARPAEGHPLEPTAGNEEEVPRREASANRAHVSQFWNSRAGMARLRDGSIHRTVTTRGKSDDQRMPLG